VSSSSTADKVLSAALMGHLLQSDEKVREESSQSGGRVSEQDRSTCGVGTKAMPSLPQHVSLLRASGTCRTASLKTSQASSSRDASCEMQGPLGARMTTTLHRWRPLCSPARYRYRYLYLSICWVTCLGIPSLAISYLHTISDLRTSPPEPLDSRAKSS
jgi:hypothetical protein